MRLDWWKSPVVRAVALIIMVGFFLAVLFYPQPNPYFRLVRVSYSGGPEPWIYEVQYTSDVPIYNVTIQWYPNQPWSPLTVERLLPEDTFLIYSDETEVTVWISWRTGTAQHGTAIGALNRLVLELRVEDALTTSPAPTAEEAIVARDPELPEITREMVDKSIRIVYAEPDLERYLSEPHEILIMWNWPFDGHILVVDIVVNKGNFEAELYGDLMAKVDLDGEKIIEMNYHDRHECW